MKPGRGGALLQAGLRVPGRAGHRQSPICTSLGMYSQALDGFNQGQPSSQRKCVFCLSCSCQEVLFWELGTGAGSDAVCLRGCSQGGTLQLALRLSRGQ